MNPYIDKYIEQGLKIFACLPTKNPATTNGFYAATTDLEELKTQFYDDNLLIGLPTGVLNGIIVIDIDSYKDSRGVGELLEEIKEYGELPDTFQVETPSGGRHLYYLAPDTALTTQSRFLHKTLPIDIRANGGYACVPDGKNYIVYDDIDELDIDKLKSRCALIPQWISDYIKPTFVNSELTVTLPATEIREIRSALAFLSSDDRDFWLRIGMALKSINSPSDYGLWNEWSKTSEKYDPKDMEKRWKGLKPKDITIASIFHEAKKFGWVTTYQKKIPTILPPKEQKLPQIDEKENFPAKLLNPGGLVGDIASYIVDSAIKPQPLFALAAALCGVGALAGRKYQTETKIRTNIYCLCVGASGSGKEAPRKAIKSLFEAAGCSAYASVEDIASDTSIMTALEQHPSQVFLLDEIGRFLRTTTNASKNSHLYNVITILLKLFSGADQTVSGKIYADNAKKIQVVQPNLCLFGTTVPETLYKGLSIEHVTDGFLSRMLIFETENPRPRKKKRRNLTGNPPIEIIDQLKVLKKVKINHDPDGDIDELNPNPRIVEITDTAVDILEEFDDFIYDLRNDLDSQNKIESTYNRTGQMAEQIALIIAIGKNINDPIIGENEIIYGIQLSKFLSDRMLYIVNNYIAENEYHHELKRIYQIIKHTGTIRKSALTRKTQNIHSSIRDSILETLMESEQIRGWVDTETNIRWLEVKDPEDYDGK